MSSLKQALTRDLTANLDARGRRLSALIIIGVIGILIIVGELNIATFGLYLLPVVLILVMVALRIGGPKKGTRSFRLHRKHDGE